MARERTWMLIGRDGEPYASPVPGALGGHRRGKLYGRLDCRAALRAIARGGYAKLRVFFSDEATAMAAGYRACAVCMPSEYAKWKESNGFTTRLAPEASRLIPPDPAALVGAVDAALRRAAIDPLAGSAFILRRGAEPAE